MGLSIAAIQPVRATDALGGSAKNFDRKKCDHMKASERPANPSMLSREPETLLCGAQTCLDTSSRRNNRSNVNRTSMGMK